MSTIGRDVRVMAAKAGASVVVLVMFVPGAALAAFPGPNGPIAFNSDRDVGAGEIYAITPGGPAQVVGSPNRAATRPPAVGPRR